MMEFRRSLALLALCFSLSLIVTACGGGSDAASDDDSDQSSETADADNEGDNEDGEDEAPPVPVEIGQPSRGDIYAVYTGTAPIEAFAEADVIAKVAGEIRSIQVEEGDSVSAGQVLARLDGDRLRLELNESSARLRKLESDYARNVDLAEKGLISDGDFEKIKYEMEALQASHNLASLELDYTQIRSPINGVISERYIKLGNTLSVNEPVFRVTGYDPLVAYLYIPEREFSRIKAGQSAILEIDALADQRVVASVTRVSPIVDPVTGTFKIAIEISDTSQRIKPGMFARIGVVYDVHENAMQVPRSAILEDLGESRVYVVVDGKAQERIIETGFSEAGMVEVTSGLDDLDNVVVVGQLGLKDGADVNVINADEDDSTERAAEASASEESDNASTD